METWRSCLKGDPLPWLLDRGDPSMRFWALVDLLDRPQCDPEVAEARSAIASLTLVQELYALQQPGGHWGEDQTKPYTAQGTLGVLALLHVLGVSPDHRTSAGCDSLLRNCQNTSGGFSLVRTQRSGVFPCTTSEHLPFLVYFGLGDDPRVLTAIDFIIESAASEQPLTCGRYQHQDCLWGAIAILNGLAALPGKLQTDRSARAVQRMADTLLDAPYDFQGEHKRWLTFGVPRAWDLLSALRALATHGFAHDPRFIRLLDRVLDCQDTRGRWTCGSVSRTWPLEARGKPSKWVTLDALRVLKAYCLYVE
jgi:hypothetical protein